MTIHAKGSFQMKTWDEATYKQLEKEAKLAETTVVNQFSGDIVGASTLKYITIYTDATHGSYVGIEHIDGQLGGKTGSFVLKHQGSFSGNEIWGEWVVVNGSATGELAGLKGSGGFNAQVGEPSTPYTLDYSLD